MLRFDGLYRSRRAVTGGSNPCRECYRFFRGGVVMSAFVPPGEEVQVMRWLLPDRANDSSTIGTYVAGEMLHAKLDDRYNEAEIVLEGRVESGLLRLLVKWTAPLIADYGSGGSGGSRTLNDDYDFIEVDEVS